MASFVAVGLKLSLTLHNSPYRHSERNRHFPHKLYIAAGQQLEEEVTTGYNNRSDFNMQVGTLQNVRNKFTSSNLILLRVLLYTSVIVRR